MDIDCLIPFHYYSVFSALKCIWCKRKCQREQREWCLVGDMEDWIGVARCVSRMSDVGIYFMQYKPPCLQQVLVRSLFAALCLIIAWFRMKFNDSTICGCLTNIYEVFGDAWDIENIDYETSSSCELKGNFILANSLFSPIIIKCTARSTMELKFDFLEYKTYCNMLRFYILIHWTLNYSK